MPLPSLGCGRLSLCFHYVFVLVCLDICGYFLVSAENLEKSLRQMERQLLQLERDLETFSSPDDPSDMFFTKMAISFYTCMSAFVHLSVELFVEVLLVYRIMVLNMCVCLIGALNEAQVHGHF